jgi:hypothetical protein
MRPEHVAHFGHCGKPILYCAEADSHELAELLLPAARGKHRPLTAREAVATAELANMSMAAMVLVVIGTLLNGRPTQ